MNLALSDEQEFLREAARGALSRVKTIEAAREALEGERACPTCGRPRSRPAGPGLLVAEDHGGAGLGAFDAMLVAQECGRVLAGVPLLGLLPASDAAAGRRRRARIEAVAAGDAAPGVAAGAPAGRPRRAAGPSTRARGKHRAPAPRATVDGDA